MKWQHETPEAVSVTVSYSTSIRLVLLYQASSMSNAVFLIAGTEFPTIKLVMIRALQKQMAKSRRQYTANQLSADSSLLFV